MKTSLNNILNIMKYFFTPEDSTTPAKKGFLSFDIQAGRLSMGSAKALFWVMNAMILICLTSLL